MIERPISKKNCSLFPTYYIYTSLKFDFKGNLYVFIPTFNETFPIHNVSYNIENGKCWKTFTMKGKKIYDEATNKTEQIKMSVSVCLSHNRAIRIKRL